MIAEKRLRVSSCEFRDLRSCESAEFAKAFRVASFDFRDRETAKA